MIIMDIPILKNLLWGEGTMQGTKKNRNMAHRISLSPEILIECGVIIIKTSSKNGIK